jgi:hypothetical protein
MTDGYYYLHQNGSLIYKRYMDDGQVADFRESPFVQHFWSLNTKDRENAWQIVVEALAIGADPERVKELAALWQCDDKDAEHYASALGLDLYMDGNAWCARRTAAIDLACCPHGFGETVLEAFADLAKQLGMRAQKTWGPTFKSLVECPCDSSKKVDPRCAAAGECSA